MGDVGGTVRLPLVIGDRPTSDVVLAAAGHDRDGQARVDRSGPGAAPACWRWCRCAGTTMADRAARVVGPFTIPTSGPGPTSSTRRSGLGRGVDHARADIPACRSTPLSGVSGIEIIMTTRQRAVRRCARPVIIVRTRRSCLSRQSCRASAGPGLERQPRSRCAGPADATASPLPAGDYFVAALDDAAMTPWPDRAFIASLESHATRVSIGLGEHKTVDLVMSAIEKR
jgi:hypothetical protein